MKRSEFVVGEAPEGGTVMSLHMPARPLSAKQTAEYAAGLMRENCDLEHENARLREGLRVTRDRLERAYVWIMVAVIAVVAMVF